MKKMLENLKIFFELWVRCARCGRIKWPSYYGLCRKCERILEHEIEQEENDG